MMITEIASLLFLSITLFSGFLYRWGWGYGAMTRREAFVVGILYPTQIILDLVTIPAAFVVFLRDKVEESFGSVIFRVGCMKAWPAERLPR